MDIKNEVLEILDDALGLNGRAQAFSLETPLLGALPELDSMAVVAVINLMEERLSLMEHSY